MSGIKFVAHLISLFNSVGIDWGKDEGDLLEKKNMEMAAFPAENRERKKRWNKENCEV